MERPALTPIDDAVHDGIAACEDAVAACEHLANTAAEEPDRVDLVRACRDCADLASLAIRFMARHAALTPELCEVAGKACGIVVEECGKHEGVDYGACTDACARCREACLVMAA